MFPRHRMRDLFHFETPEAGSGGTPSVPGVTEEAESDVNSQEGFDKALAAKLGKDLPDGYVPAQSTSISDGLTFGAERPRDPETGRFLPDQKPETPEAPAPPEALEAPAAPEAPAVPTAEERLAALEKQLQDSQEMIGRQAQEIGQLRQQPVQQQPAQPIPYVSQEQAEQVYSWVEQAGFKDAMLWTIQNNPSMHDVVLQAGRDMDLPEAREYEINLRVQEALMAQQARQPQAPAEDPFVTQLKTGEAMKAVVAKIKGDTPDFAQLQPNVQKALQEHSMLADLVASGEAEKMEQGLRLATGVARGYAASELAAAAAREAGARTEQRQQEKVAAGAATGSATLGGGVGQTGEAPTQEQRDEAIASFKKAIMEAPGTSIADGLTFG